MAPIKQGKYEFRHSSLTALRQRMKLKQKKMAELLEIPANTLSRWENGVTKPDADSLAAIYSLAKEHGVTAEFFERRKPTAKLTNHRSRLIVTWDFEGVAVQSHQLPEIESWIKSELDRRFSSSSQKLFKAFAWTSQSKEADELSGMGWRVFEDDEGLVDAIYDDARSDCGHDPTDTTYVLIAKEELYVELVNELRDRGVRVYLITPPRNYEQALIEAVDSKRWIMLPDDYSPPTILSMPRILTKLIGR